MMPDRSHRYPRITLSGRKRYVHQLLAETWGSFGNRVEIFGDDTGRTVEGEHSVALPSPVATKVAAAILRCDIDSATAQLNADDLTPPVKSCGG